MFSSAQEIRMQSCTACHRMVAHVTLFSSWDCMNLCLCVSPLLPSPAWPPSLFPFLSSPLLPIGPSLLSSCLLPVSPLFPSPPLLSSPHASPSPCLLTEVAFSPLPSRTLYSFVPHLWTKALPTKWEHPFSLSLCSTSHHILIEALKTYNDVCAEFKRSNRTMEFIMPVAISYPTTA